MDIRLEIPADYRETETLTREAFWNQYVPGCAEHLVLHQLRRHPDFVPALDFVAEEDDRLVGHIAYTRAVICREGRDSLAVLCLGPVSVLPERQRAGDPRYYHRFGFRCAEKYDIRTEDGFYAAALHALELKPGALADAAGRFAESPGYAVDEKALAAFDAGFAPKHREKTPSQQEFRFLASLRY
ncbi:MAG: N-acetyltransferase [Clostridiales bacterium]|nr:N-acetyltransferase [Clostridiales bacterium]